MHVESVALLAVSVSERERDLPANLFQVVESQNSLGWKGVLEVLYAHPFLLELSREETMRMEVKRSVCRRGVWSTRRM